MSILDNVNVTLIVFLAFLSLGCQNTSAVVALVVSPDAKVAQLIHWDFVGDINESSNQLAMVEDLADGDFTPLCDLPTGSYIVTFCEPSSVAFMLADRTAGRLDLVLHQYEPECHTDTLITAFQGDLAYDWMLLNVRCLSPLDSILVTQDSLGIRIRKIMADGSVTIIAEIAGATSPATTFDGSQLMAVVRKPRYQRVGDDSTRCEIVVYDFESDSTYIAVHCPTLPRDYKRQNAKSPIYYLRPDSLEGARNLYRFDADTRTEMRITDYSLPQWVRSFHLATDSLSLHVGEFGGSADQDYYEVIRED